MRLLTACGVSAAIVLASPFMGRLQSLLRSSVSTRAYLLLLGGVVGGAIVAAIVIAFVRITGHRGARVAAMAAALGLGFAYTTVMSTGEPTIDAVERVHFIEYGLIAVLFYRVWRPSTSLGADASTVVMPLLCGFVVGTLDEWLQWFIPYRVGEMHDVFLNLTALWCGVLFGMALEPPPTLSLRLPRRARSRIGVAAAIAVVVFAAFVDSVHVGYLLDVDGIGRFDSLHTIDELNALQADRASRWQVEPPIGIRRLSREDQYLDEALWHVRERNQRWDAGDITAAWHENLILERLFTPVLDLPTYASANGTRWPAAHRADAARRLTPASEPFVSAAAPRTIYHWPKGAYWSVIAVLAVVCLWPAWRDYSAPKPSR